MTYRTVDVDDLPNAPNPTTAKKEVDEALGVESFGFNVYTVAPGERVPWGFHSHPRHEEVFYVLDGVLTVDTAGPDRRRGGRGAPRAARASELCAQRGRDERPTDRRRRTEGDGRGGHRGAMRFVWRRDGPAQ